MTVVGVVGLGTMGAAIAQRLIDVGHEVHGTNRTASKAEPLIDSGLVWHGTPREVAEASDLVISMVTDDQALKDVTAGRHGIAAGLSPGQLYIDMSSVSPRASVDAAARARSVAAPMLDAPVSGTVPQVLDGTLFIMVGGALTAFQQAEPLLSSLGRSVVRVGRNGQGVLLKLAINLNLAVQVLAFSEGLLMAERGGIDPGLAADIMASSAIGSPSLQGRAPLMLTPPEQAWFDIALMDKDVRLALAEAERLRVPALAAVAAAEALDKARDIGYDDQDIAALYQALDEMSGQPDGG
jgi:3-hydroxyisobutyrate dehydrogenase-like beta-hydroxyacid dehydrogenase